MRAKDLIGPDERPAVGMKLGGGNVEISQELDFLERRCIDKAEGPAVVTLVISADGLARGTRMHRYLVIVFVAERKVGWVTFLETEDIAFRVDG